MIDRRTALSRFAGSFVTCGLLRSGLAIDDEPETSSLDSVPVSEIQFLGTHNSYHIAPDQAAADLIRLAAPNGVQQLNYTHPPLTEQLSELGIRQFEWDLYRDSRGGRYAEPAALQVASQQGIDVEPFDPDSVMKEPGAKILHAPDFDFRSHSLTLKLGWKELLAWSELHPKHEPVFLLLELKEESYLPSTRPEPWDQTGLSELESEIRECVGVERLLTPHDLARGEPTLRGSVENRGWPTLGELRGKFVLLLDNEDEIRDRYLSLDGGWRDRLIFTSVPQDHEAAAWLKINDPIRSGDRIARLVDRGFLIRTRADSGLAPRFNDSVAQRDAALQSGAQLISTDFPTADPLAPNYSVRFSGSVQVKCR